MSLSLDNCDCTCTVYDVFHAHLLSHYHYHLTRYIWKISLDKVYWKIITLTACKFHEALHVICHFIGQSTVTIAYILVQSFLQNIGHCIIISSQYVDKCHCHSTTVTARCTIRYILKVSLWQPFHWVSFYTFF